MKKIFAIIIIAAAVVSCGCKGWSCKKRYVLQEKKALSEKKNA